MHTHKKEYNTVHRASEHLSAAYASALTGCCMSGSRSISKIAAAGATVQEVKNVSRRDEKRAEQRAKLSRAREDMVGCGSARTHENILDGGVRVPVLVVQHLEHDDTCWCHVRVEQRRHKRARWGRAWVVGREHEPHDIQATLKRGASRARHKSMPHLSPCGLIVGRCEQLESSGADAGPHPRLRVDSSIGTKGQCACVCVCVCVCVLCVCGANGWSDSILHWYRHRHALARIQKRGTQE